MIRFLLILICFVLAVLVIMSMPAPAQSPSHTHSTRPDEVTLILLQPDHGVIEFWNSDAQTSFNQTRQLVDGDLTVDVSIAVGADGPETLTVMAPQGWLAIPPFIAVQDGEIGRIDLIRGEWHGS